MHSLYSTFLLNKEGAIMYGLGLETTALLHCCSRANVIYMRSITSFSKHGSRKVCVGRSVECVIKMQDMCVCSKCRRFLPSQ